MSYKKVIKKAQLSCFNAVPCALLRTPLYQYPLSAIPWILDIACWLISYILYLHLISDKRVCYLLSTALSYSCITVSCVLCAVRSTDLWISVCGSAVCGSEIRRNWISARMPPSFVGNRIQRPSCGLGQSFTSMICSSTLSAMPG
jgi:hypothetical protein